MAYGKIPYAREIQISEGALVPFLTTLASEVQAALCFPDHAAK
jgi:hypothetical protein